MDSKHTLQAITHPKRLCFRLGVVVSILGLFLCACQPKSGPTIPLETASPSSEIIQEVTKAATKKKSPTQQSTPTKRDNPLIQDTPTPTPEKD